MHNYGEFFQKMTNQRALSLHGNESVTFKVKMQPNTLELRTKNTSDVGWLSTCIMVSTSSLSRRFPLDFKAAHHWANSYITCISARKKVESLK